MLFHCSFFVFLQVTFCGGVSIENIQCNKIYYEYGLKKMFFFLKFNKVISKCAHPIFNSSMYYILNKKFKTIVTVGDMCSFLLSS